MVTFRNNNRRPSFRGSNNNRRPTFRRNDDNSKFQSSNFQRKMPSRNNNNAPKLIEKYNDLAREALANEDKILSENYFQHADHFTRVLNEQENSRVSRINTTSIETNKTKNIDEEKKDSIVVDEDKENQKLSDKEIVEKETAAS
ncbi:DUF4167 domain-containing protein [Candidatus Pelagibacter bacterium]|nr:DUF4167 domain-containing protein [Candidatus Pelagibacter bacterium]